MDLLSPPEDSHRTTTTPSVNNSSHDTKHNMKEQQTGASDDISDVAKKIRREIRRIRNERQKLAEGGGVASQVGGGASKEKSRANITSREAQPVSNSAFFYYEQVNFIAWNNDYCKCLILCF